MSRYPEWGVLRRRRRLLDVTVQDVAKELGCSASLISEYERGWQPKRRHAVARWRQLAVQYARLLDEWERKSKGGLLRSKEEENADSEPDAAPSYA